MRHSKTELAMLVEACRVLAHQHAVEAKTQREHGASYAVASVDSIAFSKKALEHDTTAANYRILARKLFKKGTHA